MRCRRNKIPGRHSLSLMVKNKYAVQKMKIARKEQSILDDEEQICGPEDMKCQDSVDLS